jgi:hypothetical protein
MDTAHNLELKATVADIDAFEVVVLQLPPHHAEVQHQVDTYFHAR